MAKNLDVLFINPGALSEIYQSLSRDLAAIEPPIWAALLANGTRNKGFTVDIIDLEAQPMSEKDFTSEVEARNPKLVVIVVYGQQPSASTQNMHGARIIAQTLKNNCPEIKTLMLGGHISSLPERTLKEEPVDFVCRGEGLYTITALAELSDLNRTNQLSKVPGLYYFDDEGEVSFNPPSKVISQADLTTELPGMAWDLLPMPNYRAHNWHCFDHINERQPYASLYTSLGCPFRCSFCCINAPFRFSGASPAGSFRYWDPDFMIQEFDLLATKYGVKNVKIADEMFVLNEKHFMRLCEKLIERDYGFNIWAYARVDTIKPKYLETLKRAGVNWLVLGIESNSKHVRDGVQKGRFKEEDILSVVNMIKDAGIYVHGNYIFGLPDDDAESLKSNLEMAIDLNCEMSNFYSAMAYPGSLLYEQAVSENLPLPENWLGYSQHSVNTLPLPSKNLSGGEILYFRDRAWQAYYTNPSYHKLLKDKFGQDTLDHVKEMTQHRLERSYSKHSGNLDFTYSHFESRDY